MSFSHSVVMALDCVGNMGQRDVHMLYVVPCRGGGEKVDGAGGPDGSNCGSASPSILCQFKPRLIASSSIHVSMFILTSLRPLSGCISINL